MTTKISLFHEVEVAESVSGSHTPDNIRNTYIIMSLTSCREHKWVRNSNITVLVSQKEHHHPLSSIRTSMPRTRRFKNDIEGRKHLATREVLLDKNT